ncbi:MAG: hypothetical protein L0Y58_23775 [Verrucomicrobia subdivision 3 bacterium]|nr:hypothetical protein [Limisphaerales bacterium]
MAVFELLTANGLDNYYQLSQTVGVRIRAASSQDQFQFMDDPPVRERLVDFTDGRVTRVTFHIPAIHCIACVWLLENLFRIRPGIGKSQVDFPRKKVAITFENARLKLSELVTLLCSLGYVIGVGLLGRPIQLALGRNLQKLVPFSIAFVGALLVLRGLALGIPYLSPQLSGDCPACR